MARRVEFKKATENDILYVLKFLIGYKKGELYSRTEYASLKECIVKIEKEVRSGRTTDTDSGMQIIRRLRPLIDDKEWAKIANLIHKRISVRNKIDEPILCKRSHVDDLPISLRKFVKNRGALKLLEENYSLLLYSARIFSKFFRNLSSTEKENITLLFTAMFEKYLNEEEMSILFEVKEDIKIDNVIDSTEFFELLTTMGDDLIKYFEENEDFLTFFEDDYI